MESKAGSIIGFAVRANKVIFGAEMLEQGKRKRYLIIFSPTASENTKRTIFAVAKRDKVPLIMSEELLRATHKDTCKVIGIANKQMSDAIINYLDPKENLLIKSEEI